MKYLPVTVTPELITDIHNAISAYDKDSREYREISTWLGYANREIYKAWLSLPEGDHLKLAYEDQAWLWDDQDLHGPAS